MPKTFKDSPKLAKLHQIWSHYFVARTSFLRHHHHYHTYIHSFSHTKSSLKDENFL